MSSLRSCPGCGRKFRAGKKALVLGTMRTVCLVCSEGAIRMVVSVTNAKCSGFGPGPECNAWATYCPKHAEAMRADAVAQGHAPVRAALEAMLRGLTHVAPRKEERETDALLEEYLRGKVEGIEAAIELLRQASSIKVGAA